MMMEEEPSSAAAASADVLVAKPTEQKKRKPYSRAMNSYCCSICRQYHQSARKGECRNIKVPFPVFADFLQRTDPSFAAVDPESPQYTEIAIRRIMGLLSQHETEFREWAAASDATMSPEAYSHLAVPAPVKKAPEKPVELAAPVAAVEKKKTNRKKEEEAAPEPPSKKRGMTEPSLLHPLTIGNPPPPLLSYAYLKEMRALVELA